MKKSKQIPLIIEPHPKEYNGLPFITLLKYKQQTYLAIVDRSDNKKAMAYVLDMCSPEQVDEQVILQVATNWWDNYKDRYPLSFQFSKLGLTSHVVSIYREFNIDYITRVIGPFPKHELNKIHKIRRRKRKQVPKGMVVNIK